MDEEILFDIFLESDESDALFDLFQSALWAAFCKGYEKGKATIKEQSE